MKKSIFSIIFILLLTTVMPLAKSETVVKVNAKELIQLLTAGKNKASNTRLKKRKLKKVVRKAARVYRKVKSDRESRKKSRKYQRKARRIINIF